MQAGEPSWRNPQLSLGMRCVLFARHEMDRGVKSAPYGKPNTSPEVAKYLGPCVRYDVDGDGKLDPMGLTQGNWCAAFASACVAACILPGETSPHLYRAGVVEMVADAKKLGAYHSVQEVRSGKWAPSVGDLAIWDRSTDDPATSWWRHVNRVVNYNPISDHLTTIGGNERRAIRLTAGAPKHLSNRKLLGFISYSRAPGKAAPVDDDLSLISLFVSEHYQDLTK